MSDLTATLRRLADACDACDRLAGNFESSVTECFHEQRQVLADALPGIGWDGAVKDLRAMADEADRLRAALRAVADVADSWADDAYNHGVPLPRGGGVIADALGVTESHDDVTARDIAAALRAMVEVSDV